MKHKKFMDIERIKETNVNGFEKCDEIIIQEKIDGSNAAIRYDSENDCAVAQSRKHILSIDNNLRGMYEWSQTLDKDRVREVLGDNLVFFGEWLCLSGDTVIRKTSGGKNNNYMTLREMYEYKHKPIPDRIHHGLDKGRPFIIKNIIDNPDISDDALFKMHSSNYYPSYKKAIKWLIENDYIFANNNRYKATKQGINWYEHHVKVVSPEQLKAQEENKALCESIVTEARVTKILHKLVDEGILPENWGAKEMGIVAKNLCGRVFEDCMKEEPETVSQIENFGKVANSICMSIARKCI